MQLCSCTVRRAVKVLCTFDKFKTPLHSAIKMKIHHGYVCHRVSDAIPQNGPWSVLFFGTDNFALESLKVLHAMDKSKILQRLEVVTVLTKKGNAVNKYANENGIIVNNWPLEINVSKFHIGLLVSFGHLIPSNIIHSFPLGMLNVHASLLPRWRGSSPLIYALMNGDTQTGVTLMKIMPKKFDIGEIVLQKRIHINEHETLPELHNKLAKLGANLITEVFKNLLQSLQSSIPQNEANVTYAPKVTSKISLIKWNEMSAKNVYDLYRALLELYPLTTKFEGIKIKLLDIQKHEQPCTILEGETHGTVIYDRSIRSLIIKCKGNSYISVQKLIIEGRPAMSANDFHNGFIHGRRKTKTLFC